MDCWWGSEALDICLGPASRESLGCRVTVFERQIYAVFGASRFCLLHTYGELQVRMQKGEGMLEV